MNIGILSMQKIINYGSVLQAYSLKKIIEENIHGGIVFFVDPNEENSYQIISQIDTLYDYKNKKRPNLKQILKKIIYKFQWIQLNNKIIDFQYNALCVDKKSNHIDCLVIGSDEVFGCNNIVKRDFFGGEKSIKKQISYAASCGYTTADDIPLNHFDDMKEDLSNLKAVSVRDQGTNNFVSFFVDKQVEYHLDPVFIGGLKGNKKNHKEKYMIVYAYPERIYDNKEIENIERFAENNNLKTIFIGGHQLFKGNFITPGPLEVLDYFANAEYVITDTFHGCVFSIVNNIKFGIFVRDSNSNKVCDLLNKFQLEDRELNCLTYEEFENKIKADVEWGRINDYINFEKQRSINYLKKNLEI